MDEAGKGGALALLACLLQQGGDAGGKLGRRFFGVDGSAEVWVRAVVGASLVVVTNGSPEAVAAPHREQLLEQRCVNRVETAALQKTGVNLACERVSLVSDVAPERKTMSDDAADQHRDERPRGGRPPSNAGELTLQELDHRIMFWIAISYIPLLIGVFLFSR